MAIPERKTSQAVSGNISFTDDRNLNFPLANLTSSLTHKYRHMIQTVRIMKKTIHTGFMEKQSTFFSESNNTLLFSVHNSATATNKDLISIYNMILQSLFPYYTDLNISLSLLGIFSIKLLGT